MSFRGQLIKLGFNTDGISNALWQSAARYAVGGNVASGTAFRITGDDRTIGIDINADCVTGIKFTGSYTLTAIQIGDGTTALTLAAADDHAIDIYTTCAIASNSGSPINAFYLKSTTTGTQSEDWTMSVHSLTDIYSGNENTVGHFYSQWGTTSGIGPLGMASAVTAKMLLPTSCTGAFFAFYGKMNMPASPAIMDPAVGAGNSAGWFLLSTGGVAGGITSFSNYGRFMEIHNIVAGTGKMLSLTGQTLRCAVPNASTIRHLVLSQMADGLGLGNSTTDMALGTSITQRAVSVYTSSTSTDTDDSIRPYYLRHTVLGTGGVGHRAEFHTRCDVVVGDWINALKGYMEFDNAAGSGTTGRTTGLASAICAEMALPGWAMTTGQYFPLEIELVGQSGSGIGNMSGFITVRASGTLTTWNSSAYFLQVAGLSAGATAMLSTNSQTLKCRMGTYASGATRYMVLSQAADCLSLTTTATPIVIAAGSTATACIGMSGILAGTNSRAINCVVTQPNAAHGDGYGCNEFDVTLTGTSTSHVAAVSSWINITASGTHGGGGSYINALSLGVYIGATPTIGAARVNFGFRASYQGGQSPAKLHLISYSSPGVDMDSIFHVGQFHTNTGFVAGSGESGGYGNYAKMFMDDGGNLGYVRVYFNTT